MEHKFKVVAGFDEIEPTEPDANGDRWRQYTDNGRRHALCYCGFGLEGSAAFVNAGIEMHLEEQPMTFDGALGALLTGKMVQRKSWNDQAFVALMPGYPDGIPLNEVTARVTGLPEGMECRFSRYFLRCYGARDFQTGWLPGLDDLLATDWRVVMHGEG